MGKKGFKIILLMDPSFKAPKILFFKNGIKLGVPYFLKGIILIGDFLLVFNLTSFFHSILGQKVFHSFFFFLGGGFRVPLSKIFGCTF